MTETNRAHWDELAELHGQDDYYDTEALVAGADTLTEAEDAAVREAVSDRGGGLAGLDVVHLQSHIGFDSISLARRGARVTCVDFSAAALAKAGTLAARCGVELELVEADTQALPASLHGRFDLAYATIGVLSWIGDLDAWMRGAAAVLRPGGRLVLVELHPLWLTVDTLEPLSLDFPYAFDGPHGYDEPGTYASASASVGASATVQYAHSLGEIVTAAARAGLHVDALHEHLDVDVDGRMMLSPGADGRVRLVVGGQALPLLYTLLASRPS